MLEDEREREVDLGAVKREREKAKCTYSQERQDQRCFPVLHVGAGLGRREVEHILHGCSAPSFLRYIIQWETSRDSAHA